MPIGDPHGGNFEYTVEGLPESIFACVIPVRDPVASAGFYSEILGMRELGSDEDNVYMVTSGRCSVWIRRTIPAAGS